MWARRIRIVVSLVGHRTWGTRHALARSAPRVVSLESSCILPVTTVPHGCQTESLQGKRRGSTSQHSTTWLSDGRLMRKEAGLRAQRGSVCSTSQHSTTWLSDEKLVKKEAGLRVQCGFVCSTSQHSTTWLSDGRLVRKEAGLRAQCQTLCWAWY